MNIRLTEYKQWTRRTFGSQPTIIVVEPTDHGTNIEGSPYGVELVVCPWNLCACLEEGRQSVNRTGVSSRTIGYDGSLDNWTHETSTFLEPQTLQAAPNRINEAQAGGFVCQLRVNFVVVDVVRNVNENLVRLWTNCRLAMCVVAHFAKEDWLGGKLGSGSDALRVGCAAKASRKLKRP